MADHGGPPPTVPEGWQVSWSDQYNHWYYVHPTTGASQWEHPSDLENTGQPAATPQPGCNLPAQPQYAPQGFAPPPTADQPATPAKTGIMGKLSNLDLKTQTAQAVSDGLAKGALLEHEIEKFHISGHGGHGGHHNVLDTMAGLISAAGAGVLGAKLFGGMEQAAQAAPPPSAPPPSTPPPSAPPPSAPPTFPALPPGAPASPASPPGAPVYPALPPGAPAYPIQAPPPPVYPSQPMPPGVPSSGPGLGGLEKLEVGGAAGVGGALAASGASNGASAGAPAAAGKLEVGDAAGVTGALAASAASSGASAGVPTVAGGSDGMASSLDSVTNPVPRLIIHGAAYADIDVTDKVRALVTPEQVLNFGNWNAEFGDPWPENSRKMFNVLYQYGDRPLEVWAGSNSDGKVNIKKEALSNARMSYINKDPGRIISLIWGYESILNKERVEKLENDGELDCSGLSNGGYYGYEKWGVNMICYYRTSDGGVGVGRARPGGTLRLPWNPLAKWS